MAGLPPAGPCSGASGSAADADQLAVDELLGRELAQLAAEPGALDAAERQLRGIGADDVHEHHAGVDLVGDAQRLLLVGGEEVGAEAERRVVRELDRLLLGADRVDDRDRPEQLLAVARRCRARRPSARRPRKKLPLRAPPSSFGAAGDGALQLVLQPVGRGLRRQRAHRGVGRAPGSPVSTDVECGGQLRHERRRTGRTETTKRFAALHAWPAFSRRAATANSTTLSRSSVLSRMNGSEPPGLEHDLLQVAARHLGDGGAGALGAGHRHALDARVGDRLSATWSFDA